MKHVIAASLLVALAATGCLSSSSYSTPAGGANTSKNTEACTTDGAQCQETTGPASSLAAQRSACIDSTQVISPTCTLTPRVGCCAAGDGVTKVCHFGTSKNPYAQACTAARGTWIAN